MARTRMTILYDRSMEHDALVLGTSNKTELLLGYGTIHGDLASAINPLGDLYKTQVRELSKALGIPRSILAKAPSADLWPSQTDEKDLGFSYGEADRILALLVDGRLSVASVVGRGYPSATVRRIQATIVRSQYKRRMPVIAKVSTRSLGWDFRYPRDWRS
jgi:NAD+ synthase